MPLERIQHDLPLLHAAVFAREFADVIVFMGPSSAGGRALFAVLTRLGWIMGYRALEPRYAAPHGHVVPEPWVLAAAGLASSSAGQAPDGGSAIEDPVVAFVRGVSLKAAPAT